jgi:hypothetical protein
MAVNRTALQEPLMSIPLILTPGLFSIQEPGEHAGISLRQRLQRLWAELRTAQQQRAAAREAAAMSEVLEAVDAMRRGQGHDFLSARHELDVLGR